MSEIVKQENLVELDTAPIFDDMIDRNISTFISESVDEIVSAGVEILSTSIVSENTAIQKASKVISSPQQMKLGFKEVYVESINEINVKDSLLKQKSAFLKTLQSMDYKVEQPEIILADLKMVFTASSTKEFTSKVDTLMGKIQVQHSEYMIKNASSIVKQATMNVGFAQDMMVNQVNNKTVIVASNNGKALLTEINYDVNKNRIDVTTETIGFDGEGCSKVMQAFQDELKNAGLKFTGSNKKWTGGECWLPNSKSIEKSINNKKASQESEKSRRLNLKRNAHLKSQQKH